MEIEAADCLLISDFNLATFGGYLRNDTGHPALLPRLAPPGPILPLLLGDGRAWEPAPDVAIVWTQPEGVVEGFRAALDFERPPLEALLAEVSTFAAALRAAARRVRVLLAPSWVLPTHQRGFGASDLAEGGLVATLQRMNTALADALRDAPNAHLLHTGRWIEAAGPGAFDARYWYAAKVPFSNAVFKDAVLDVKAALAGIDGRSRKLVVVDLDDTLWGGVVGDVGWENLRLGGHDPVGEAFSDFQRALLALQRRGVALAVVSKNEESVALEAMRRHPEMRIRPDDLAAWRIDRRDKAENLVDIAGELNLGLDSVAFIDDNPAERGRVREALPEVLVPEWPTDKLLFARTLQSLRCFDSPVLTREDQARAAAYRVERRRRSVRREVGTIEEWLASLDLRVLVEPLGSSNLKRAVQLLNKTNQMNLSTRRLTEAELLSWLAGEDRQLDCLRVADRFGDSGLTGIVSTEVRGRSAHIVDFVLSCRVFGRRIEQLMTAIAVERARVRGAEWVEAKLIETARNRPCREFWDASGFERDGPSAAYRWCTERSYDPPKFISVSHA